MAKLELPKAPHCYMWMDALARGGRKILDNSPSVARNYADYSGIKKT